MKLVSTFSWRLSIAGLLYAVVLSPAWGQSLEITPFYGYKFGGNIPVGANDFSSSKIEFEDSPAYGVSLGGDLGDFFGVEFLWNRQSTEAVAAGGVALPPIDVNIDQYHGNVLVHFNDPNESVRPYVLFGVGATNASGGDSSETKFSYGVGGGVKFFMTPHFGLRVQARYAPTYLFSTSDGLWCNWYGACWVVTSDTFAHQMDVTAGAIFRF